MADVKPENTTVEDHNPEQNDSNENNSVGEEDGHDEVRSRAFLRHWLRR